MQTPEPYCTLLITPMQLFTRYLCPTNQITSQLNLAVIVDFDNIFRFSV